MGHDTRVEGSLKSSGAEQLSGWAQCLEQGRHLDVFCWVVDIFLLKTKRAEFGPSAYVGVSPARGCRTHFGEGQEHIVDHSWVCSLDVIAANC